MTCSQNNNPQKSASSLHSSWSQYHSSFTGITFICVTRARITFSHSTLKYTLLFIVTLLLSHIFCQICSFLLVDIYWRNMCSIRWNLQRIRLCCWWRDLEARCSDFIQFILHVWWYFGALCHLCTQAQYGLYIKNSRWNDATQFGGGICWWLTTYFLLDVSTSHGGCKHKSSTHYWPYQRSC